MPAPDLSATEAAIVARFDAAPDLPESFRGSRSMHARLTEVIGSWMAAPYEPEDWQIVNASDLADAIIDSGVVGSRVVQ